MSNPIYDALVGTQGDSPMDIIQQFQRFRQEKQGINPTEEINKLLRSGEINQQQLNFVQHMAEQMRHIFGAPFNLK